MVELALGLVILYVAFKVFVKAEAPFKKWLWGFIGVVVLLTTRFKPPGPCLYHRSSSTLHCR